MKKNFLLLSASLIVLAGCGNAAPAADVMANTASSSAVTTASQSQTATGTGQSYTLTDVAQHATASDCWMALSGQVYDFTAYIPAHPDGDSILAGCGQDATALFAGHSGRARQLAAQYLIGSLK